MADGWWGNDEDEDKKKKTAHANRRTNFLDNIHII
jgi:hypothetical protein